MEQFPKSTVVQFEYVPMIQAASILGGGNTSQDAIKAIDALAAAAPYELGTISALGFALYPAYLRPQARLAAHQGAAAAAEFQKILDHPGVVSEPIGVLAHLGLGRALRTRSPERGRPGRQWKRTNSGQDVLRPRAYGRRAARAKKPGAPTRTFSLCGKTPIPTSPPSKQAKAEYARLGDRM